VPEQSANVGGTVRESKQASAPVADDARRRMFRTVIHGSITDVWHEITRSDAPIPCFFNTRMDRSGAAPGARLRMRSGDGAYTSIVGDILEWDPPRRFAHTFRFTQLDDPPCVVRYDLKELAEGVEFTLTVDEITPGTKTAKQMLQGSPLIVATLKATIERRPIPKMMRFIHVMSRLMQPLTPKRCRSVNWS